MTKKDWKIVIVASSIALALIILAFVIRAKARRKLNCKSRYLFIGDSTTAHSQSYADQLRSICGAKVDKFAKSGAKTDWMLGTMNNHFAQNPEGYDVITILAGSNDIFARLSIDQAKVNMQQMINMALSKANNVVLVAPPSKAFYPNTTEKHRQLIAQWEEFLKSMKGKAGPGKRIHYIDLPKVVNEQQYFASDMQHMNTQGHTVLLGEYIDTLRIKNT